MIIAFIKRDWWAWSFASTGYSDAKPLGLFTIKATHSANSSTDRDPSRCAPPTVGEPKFKLKEIKHDATRWLAESGASIPRTVAVLRKIFNGASDADRRINPKPKIMAEGMFGLAPSLLYDFRPRDTQDSDFPNPEGLEHVMQYSNPYVRAFKTTPKTLT